MKGQKDGKRKEEKEIKKLFVDCSSIICCFFALRTQIGNSIGDFLHYFACPNCGDSCWWKSMDGSLGVMICKKCLANPAELDEERIEQNLLSYPEGGWTPEATAWIKDAVIRYKKEKLQNQGEKLQNQ